MVTNKSDFFEIRLQNELAINYKTYSKLVTNQTVLIFLQCKKN